MDDLIDELIELYDDYHEAKAILRGCSGNDYVCRPYVIICDECKDKIKATIKKIVEINKEG